MQPDFTPIAFIYFLPAAIEIAIPIKKHIIISIHFSPIADTNRATSDFFFGFFTFGLAGCVP